MSIKEFAEQLSDVLMQIEDLRVQAKSIVEDAKEAGVSTKALNKVAREMIMDSTKLQRRLEDEQQVDLFRDEVGLLRRKGLAPNNVEQLTRKTVAVVDSIVQEALR
jgi:F0F1-type ATP synthase membrane subunit b/b'